MFLLGSCLFISLCPHFLLRKFLTLPRVKENHQIHQIIQFHKIHLNLINIEGIHYLRLNTKLQVSSQVPLVLLAAIMYYYCD